MNGEDFFTGSPKVALENLPAYTVDEVKVYERMNDRDRALGYTKEEVGKQPLAMDVQLKKQYSMGGFANVGGAYGTDGHYGVRPAVYEAVAHRHVCQHQRLHGRLFL